MTRLLDVMEEYLVWKQYRYLRLDGHTSGMERGALIEQFNRADSPFFIFLLRLVKTWKFVTITGCKLYSCSPSFFEAYYAFC